MNYTVASENFEGKKKGESITDKELLELGSNLEALVAGGHLTSNAPTKPATEKEAE